MKNLNRYLASTLALTMFVSQLSPIVGATNQFPDETEGLLIEESSQYEPLLEQTEEKTEETETQGEGEAGQDIQQEPESQEKQAFSEEQEDKAPEGTLGQQQGNDLEMVHPDGLIPYVVDVPDWVGKAQSLNNDPQSQEYWAVLRPEWVKTSEAPNGERVYSYLALYESYEMDGEIYSTNTRVTDKSQVTHIKIDEVVSSYGINHTQFTGIPEKTVLDFSDVSWWTTLYNLGQMGTSKIKTLDLSLLVNVENIDRPGPLWNETVILPPNIKTIPSFGGSHFKNIVIPDSATSIAHYAFQMCSKLESIEIPDGVEEIGTFVFKDCTSLESVVIPDAVTSIGASAFEGCSSLESIVISENVTSIGEKAFFKCESIKNVVIPEGVTTISNFAFSECSLLEEVVISKGVKTIGNNAFDKCSVLTSVIIPEGVTSIGSSAFYLTSLISLNIPSSVETIGNNAFSTNFLTLKGIQVNSPENSIAGAPWGAVFGKMHYSDSDESLVEIYDGDGNCFIASSDSEGNASILGIKSQETNSLFSSGEPLRSAIGEEYIVVAIEANAFYGNTSIGRVAIPEGVTSIGNSAFSGCSSIKELVIPSTTETIGSSAFSGMSTLGALSIKREKEEIQGAPWGASEDLILYGEDAGVISYLTDVNGNTFKVALNKELGTAEIQKFVESASADVNINSTLRTSGGEEYTVTSIGDSAFRNCPNLTSVTIPEGVTSIGSNAFDGCSSLTSITIPEGVTSIGDSAFRNCPSLTSVAIPEGVTSIGSNAFSSCSKLASVIIPEGVTSIGDSAFRNCPSLTSVTIPEGVTSIGDRAFDGCSSLETLTVNNAENAISGAPWGADNSTLVFYITENSSVLTLTDTSGNSYLGSVNKSERTVQIKKILNVTSGDIEIGQILVSDNEDEYAVTSIGNSAFYDCSGITSITIPEGTTSIGNSAFRGCSSLASITIPEGVISIGDHAFYDCSKLLLLNIPSSVKVIGNRAFPLGGALKVLKINNLKGVIAGDDWDVGYYARILYDDSEEDLFYDESGNIFIGKGDAEAKTLEIVKIIKSTNENLNVNSILRDDNREAHAVTSIGSSAFKGCSDLTSVTISESVTSIGDSAFYGCSNLTSVIIPEGVTSIGDYAFYYCSNLTSVIIPEGVTSIGDSVFRNCSRLAGIIVQNEKESIEGHPWGASNNTKVVYTKGETDLVLLDDNGNLFAGDIDKENGTVKITKFIKSTELNVNVGGTLRVGSGEEYTVTSIGDSAFYYCRSLTSVTIPEGVTSIGSNAFYGCSNLTSVTIPEGVISIGDSAFSGCSSLISVTVPESVTSIGSNAFYWCSSLATIFIQGTEGDIEGSPWGASSSITSIVYLDVQDECSASATYGESIILDVMFSVPSVQTEENQIAYLYTQDDALVAFAPVIEMTSLMVAVASIEIDTAQKELAMGENTLTLKYGNPEEDVEIAITVTLEAKDVSASDVEENIILDYSDNIFEPPVIEGIGEEKATGTFVYDGYSTETEIQTALDALKQGESLEIAYTFTANGYYAGTVTGEMTFVVPIRNNELEITDPDAFAIIKEDAVYGDKLSEIITYDLTQITAKGEPVEGTVKIFVGHTAMNENLMLVAGSYPYTIVFSSDDGKYVNAELATGAFYIAPKTLELSWSNVILPYTGKAQSPSVTAQGLVGHDKITLAIKGAATNVSDDHLATAEIVGFTSNYVLPSEQSISYVIAPVRTGGIATTSLLEDANDDGVASVGDTLTVSVNPSVLGGTESYQWFVNDMLKEGATEKTYVVDEECEKAYCVVTFSGNTVGSIKSDVMEINKEIIRGNVDLNGIPEPGETIVANVMGLENIDYSLKWLRDGEEIVGAEGETYVLPEQDLGRTISAAVTVTSPDVSGTIHSNGIYLEAVAPSIPILALESGDTQILTQWESPFDGGSEIFNYALSVNGKIVYQGLETKFVVSELVNGETYVVSLVATNDKGDTQSAEYTIIPMGESVDPDKEPDKDQDEDAGKEPDKTPDNSSGSSSGNGLSGGSTSVSPSGPSVKPSIPVEPDPEDNGPPKASITLDGIAVVRSMQEETFADIESSSWYYDATKFVYERGLMTGVSASNFAPNTDTTRGMIAQILYNIAGKPEAGSSTFVDVSSEDWYADAVSWAKSVGVANGISENEFSPNGDMTREQLVVMLYAFDKLVSEAPHEVNLSNLHQFSDVTNVSSWAMEATSWAVDKGLMSGNPDGTIAPQSTATRAELATILSQFVKMYQGYQ